MKKVLLLILILLLLCGCQKKYITYDEFYKKINSYDSYSLVLCSNECEEIEKNIQENNIYYMNTNKLTEKQELIREGILFNGGTITSPSIIIVEKGIVKAKLTSNLTTKNINEFFKNNRIEGK